MLYPNGEVYVGSFQNLRRHGGRGKMYCSDSSTHEGKWHEDERHDEGLTIYGDRSECRAIWHKGALKQVLHYQD